MTATPSLVDRLIGTALREPLVVLLLSAFAVGAGLYTAPFDGLRAALGVAGMPTDPVAVDALPDTGENQQIVFSEWPGRSPQDVEDQVTYPLTVTLLAVPGVRSVRSTSMFGVSSVFVIFDDSADFYASRARIVETLQSLPPDALPEGVRPRLGPDATALGQVFWYTLEARDADGRPSGGFDPQELRSIQDFQVRYALAAVEGVAEVASIGGFQREYQVDVDPDALRAHGVTLQDVFRAVRDSNVDVGARTIEVNQAEYMVRGLGRITDVDDLAEAVVAVRDGVPIRIREVAHVGTGPALRRGALDRGGAEAVGGVVVVRHGANPRAVVERVRQRIAELEPGLPSRSLDDGRTVRVALRPFYDRTELIDETLDTLRIALGHQLAITAIVILLMVAHLRSALLVTGLLPLGVLLTFVMMRLVGVDANVVSLAGIAIAIGTMVDTGIVLTDNVLRHVSPGDGPRERVAAIHRGAAEVGGAVGTAVLTTVVGFLPVFGMQGAEGKLFTPLAWTKTFALLAAIAIALFALPPAAAFLMRPAASRRGALLVTAGYGVLGGAAWVAVGWWAGAIVLGVAAARAVDGLVPARLTPWLARPAGIALVALLVVWLADAWQPVGVGRDAANRLFTTAAVLGLVGSFWLLRWAYLPLLALCLRLKASFLSIPLLAVALGALVWLGHARLAGLVAPTAAAVLALAAFSPIRGALAGFAARSLPRALGGAALAIGAAAFGGVALPIEAGGIAAALGVAGAGGLALLPVAALATPARAAITAAAAVAIAAVVGACAGLAGAWFAAAGAALGLVVAAAAAVASPRAAVGLGRPPHLAVALLLAVGAGTGIGAVGRSAADGPLATALQAAFPGLGEEFLPPLDEGAFLLMPVTMAHASIGEAMDVVRTQDLAIGAIPEVEDVVGKIGRVDSPLDPAPIAMIETVVTYAPEFRLDADGHVARFAVDPESGAFVRDAAGELVPDPDGAPFRQWRDAVRSPDDIWDAVAAAAKLPGVTTASKLGPIETRRVMLQTGMRAPIGVKVQGPDLATIEAFGIELERLLGGLDVVAPGTVFAERIVGKPYLEIDIDRAAIARHGLSVRAVQDVVEVAIGGRPITRTVEGRERYPVRVRYLRELRDRIDEVERIRVAAPDGTQVPLGQLAAIRYTPGPQSIRSEDGFLTGYVTFDGARGTAQVDVVAAARRAIAAAIEAGDLEVPPGVSWRFAGEYENQVRAAERLAVLLPAALGIIFLLLYLQFRAVWSTLLVFSGVFVAWAGGFLMLWAYGQPGFLAFEVFGRSARDIFQVGEVQLSVAVWVGFLALFGIATDDGVLMGTWLKQSFAARRPATVAAARRATLAAADRRIRPALMTSATTILALLPVLTSTGRGSDVMLPMAIPSFGGMVVVLITVFVVPTLWCAAEEARLGVARRVPVSPNAVPPRSTSSGPTVGTAEIPR